MWEPPLCGDRREDRDAKAPPILRSLGAALLCGEERRKIKERRGSRPPEQFFRGGFQRLPTLPFQVRRGRDVPDETAPFHQGPLDIAMPQRIGSDFVTAVGTCDDFANDFRRARAVMNRHSHFEIAGMIGTLVDALAKRTEPPA